MSILNWFRKLICKQDNLELTQCQLELEDADDLVERVTAQLQKDKDEITQLQTTLLTERNRLVVLTNQYSNLQGKLDTQIRKDKDEIIQLQTDLLTERNKVQVAIEQYAILQGKLDTQIADSNTLNKTLTDNIEKLNIELVALKTELDITKEELAQKEKDITPPTPTFEPAGVIDIYELSSLLMDLFPDAPIYLSDETYNLCTLEDVKRFLAWENTDSFVYESKTFDCDNFSRRLGGGIEIYPWATIPFGIVWTNLHALNCFVDSNKTFYFVEPQSDNVRTSLEAWQGNEIRFIVI